MNKNIITKILVISVLLILLSFSIKASIFATIGMKGLSFASPQAAGVVQNVMKVYQITTDPSGFITGEMTGKITGEIMGEIAKQSPEAAKAIQQYQQVKGWIDEGAKITEDLKMDNKGGLAGGSMILNDKERELGPMINPDNKDLSVKATNMEVSTQGEGADVSLTAKKEGYVEINGKRYYLKENSKMVIDRNGNIKETDVTFPEATNIELGGVKYDVPKNGRIVYKDGKAEIFTESGETVKINNQEIKIGEGSIKYDGKKITGKDFTYDEKRFTGIGDKPAEMTPVKEGYLLGKDTKMEDNRMIVTSEKGNVLYAKMCEDVSGFNNYVNPCAKKLTAEGDGFSVRLKEGKQFGLDIEKEDVFKYDMKGGKIILDNGEQTIYTKEEKSVIITNGGTVTEYKTINGVQESLISPESVGESIDVDVSTKSGNLVTVEDSKTGTETIYACPVEGSGAVVITGAASLLERCKSIVGLNTGTNLVGKQMWAEDPNEVITEEKMDKFDINGKVYYNKLIRTNKGTYSIYSDGSVDVWKDSPKPGFYPADFTVTDEHLEYLRIPKTEGKVPKPEVLPETPQQEIQKLLKPVEGMTSAFEKMGDAKWNKDRTYMKSIGEDDVYGIALDSEGKQGWITSLPNGKGARGDAIQAIKDPTTGKVIKYEAVDNPQVWVPMGSGKVKLISK